MSEEEIQKAPELAPKLSEKIGKIPTIPQRKPKQNSLEPPNKEVTPMNPICVLVDSLVRDSIANRVDTIKSLQTFCTALGPERTREEMIPFIKGRAFTNLEFMEDEEDVIINLIDALPTLLSCLGGKQHSYLIFEALETLLLVDNEDIAKKVKKTLKFLFDEAKEDISLLYLTQIGKLWESGEPEAKAMGLYLFSLIEVSLDEEKLKDIQKKILGSFMKEETPIKVSILEYFGKQPYLPLLKEFDILGKILKKYSNLKSSANFMKNLNDLIVLVLRHGDEELKSLALEILQNMDKFLETKKYKAKCVLMAQSELDEAKLKEYQDSGILKDMLNFQNKDKIDENYIEVFGYILENICNGEISKYFREHLEEMIELHQGYKSQFITYFWSMYTSSIKNEELSVLRVFLRSNILSILKGLKQTDPDNFYDYSKSVKCFIEGTPEDIAILGLLDCPKEIVDTALSLVSDFQDYRDIASLIDHLKPLIIGPGFLCDIYLSFITSCALSRVSHIRYSFN